MYWWQRRRRLWWWKLWNKIDSFIFSYGIEEIFNDDNFLLEAYPRQEIVKVIDSDDDKMNIVDDKNGVFAVNNGKYGDGNEFDVHDVDKG